MINSNFWNRLSVLFYLCIFVSETKIDESLNGKQNDNTY